MLTKDLLWLVGQAQKWELEARDLYLKLAAQFEEPQISSFWLQMSADESWHAEILNEIEYKLTDEERARPLSRQAEKSALAVEKILHHAKPARLFTLEQAYQLAHELEASEINAVFRLLAFDCISDKERQQLIASQIEEQDRLERFGRRYPAESRKRIRMGAVVVMA
jgi:rubrerythrin